MSIQKLTVTEKFVFKMLYDTTALKLYTGLNGDQMINAMVLAVGIDKTEDFTSGLEHSLAAEFKRIHQHYPKISASRMIQLAARIYAGMAMDNLVKDGKIEMKGGA